MADVEAYPSVEKFEIYCFGMAIYSVSFANSSEINFDTNTVKFELIYLFWSSHVFSAHHVHNYETGGLDDLYAYLRCVSWLISI